MVKRKINWDPPPDTPDPPTPPPPPPKVSRKTEAIPLGSGNNHRQAKVRNLTQAERDKIETQLFLANNGQIDHDQCVKFKVKLAPEVTIFQVTGWVTACHAKVTRGELKVNNREEYDKFIANHRSVWVTYDSEKYRSMKTRMDSSTPKTSYRTPRFQTVPASRQRIG